MWAQAVFLAFVAGSARCADFGMKDPVYTPPFRSYFAARPAVPHLNHTFVEAVEQSIDPFHACLIGMAPHFSSRGEQWVTVVLTPGSLDSIPCASLMVSFADTSPVSVFGKWLVQFFFSVDTQMMKRSMTRLHVRVPIAAREGSAWRFASTFCPKIAKRLAAADTAEGHRLNLTTIFSKAAEATCHPVSSSQMRVFRDTVYTATLNATRRSSAWIKIAEDEKMAVSKIIFSGMDFPVACVPDPQPIASGSVFADVRVIHAETSSKDWRHAAFNLNLAKIGARLAGFGNKDSFFAGIISDFAGLNNDPEKGETLLESLEREQRETMERTTNATMRKLHRTLRTHTLLDMMMATHTSVTTCFQNLTASFGWNVPLRAIQPLDFHQLRIPLLNTNTDPCPYLTDPENGVLVRHGTTARASHKFGKLTLPDCDGCVGGDTFPQSLSLRDILRATMGMATASEVMAKRQALQVFTGDCTTETPPAPDDLTFGAVITTAAGSKSFFDTPRGEKEEDHPVAKAYHRMMQDDKTTARVRIELREPEEIQAENEGVPGGEVSTHDLMFHDKENKATRMRRPHFIATTYAVNTTDGDPYEHIVVRLLNMHGLATTMTYQGVIIAQDLLGDDFQLSLPKAGKIASKLGDAALTIADTLGFLGKSGEDEEETQENET